MNHSVRQLALIGPTASGKTSLAIALAEKLNAYILSLDSLAIYKEIDIVSAKPTVEERAGIPHFGIDYLTPNQTFDVTTFITLYQELYQKAEADNKNIIIVGGTSFYLKMLIDGISRIPDISIDVQNQVTHTIQNLNHTHQLLHEIDPVYMSTIEPTDSYRIEKMLSLYLQTGISPTEYFNLYPPISILKGAMPVYQVAIERDVLRNRIRHRTEKMVEDGLINEIFHLEKRYTRAPHSMKSIGIKETLEYLDGKYGIETLKEKITTNTMRLAKRQNTFNNSQFQTVEKGSVEMLRKVILEGK